MLTTASGEPALVQRDPNFFGHASLKVAFGDASVHVPQYKPELESVVPYLSAFQPDLTLRSIQAMPGKSGCLWFRDCRFGGLNLWAKKLECENCGSRRRAAIGLSGSTDY